MKLDEVRLESYFTLAGEILPEVKEKLQEVVKDPAFMESYANLYADTIRRRLVDPDFGVLVIKSLELAEAFIEESQKKPVVKFILSMYKFWEGVRNFMGFKVSTKRIKGWYPKTSAKMDSLSITFGRASKKWKKEDEVTPLLKEFNEKVKALFDPGL